MYSGTIWLFPSYGSFPQHLHYFSVGGCESLSPGRKVFETSDGRLPPEDGSDWRHTSGKCVSGDPRHFIFRCWTKKTAICFSKFPVSNQERAVLEDPRFFERYWQICHEKLPPMNLMSALYDFLRRGEKVDFHFFVDFSAKTNLQFLLRDD